MFLEVIYNRFGDVALVHYINLSPQKCYFSEFSKLNHVYFGNLGPTLSSNLLITSSLEWGIHPPKLNQLNALPYYLSQMQSYKL